MLSSFSDVLGSSDYSAKLSPDQVAIATLAVVGHNTEMVGWPVSRVSIDTHTAAVAMNE